MSVSGSLLFVLFFSRLVGCFILLTTLSMCLLDFGDLLIKSFGDDEVTIRIGLAADESGAKLTISIVVELLNVDKSIWINDCCFCAFCCCLLLAGVSLVWVMAASLDFCSKGDVLFFVGRVVLFDGEMALRLRSVGRFWAVEAFCAVACFLVCPVSWVALDDGSAW